MKKNYSTSVVIMIFLISPILFSQAKWVDYTWNNYHVKFQLPDYFYVSINNDNEFRAATNEQDIMFQIFESLGCGDPELIKEALEDDAKRNNVYDYEKNLIKYNPNGFIGYSLSGKRLNSELKEIYMSIYVLDHPVYPVRLHIYLSFSNYVKGYILEAAIMPGFTPLD